MSCAHVELCREAPRLELSCELGGVLLDSRRACAGYDTALLHIDSERARRTRIASWLGRCRWTLNVLQTTEGAVRPRAFGLAHNSSENGMASLTGTMWSKAAFGIRTASMSRSRPYRNPIRWLDSKQKA